MLPPDIEMEGVQHVPEAIHGGPLPLTTGSEPSGPGGLLAKLAVAIEGSRLMAEAATAVAAHFRPQYEACWAEGPGLGQLINQDLCLQLRPYVLDKEQEAKSWEADRALLSEAAKHIEALGLAIREACDLLAERTYGNPARSPGHNARLTLEAALTGQQP